MKISLKILSVGLMTALSLGSIHGMGRNNRPAPAVEPQTRVQEDSELAFNLQLREVEAVSLLAESSNQQLARDEAYARSLQDGEDYELTGSGDDESELDAHEEQRRRDAEYALRLQEEFDAQGMIAPAPAQSVRPPAPAGTPVVEEEDEDCTLCSEAKANVWLMCCSKKICKGCLDQWLVRNNSCPFCRKPNPETVCECAECVHNAQSMNL